MAARPPPTESTDVSTLILRVTGAVLALLGLVAVVLGGWFLAALGASGTATFTAEPGERVVVLDQHVLNRVDEPVEITATSDGAVWAGLARPSDVETLLGDAPRTEVTGVGVRDWALTTTTIGDGDPVALGTVDIWRAATTDDDESTTTIDQERAPETLVLTAARGAEIGQVELSVTDDRWSTTAITVLVGGAVALLVGLALLVRTGLLGAARRRRPRHATPETEA